MIDKKIQLIIQSQGAVIVHDAKYIESSDRIVCLSIDLGTKYCEIDVTFYDQYKVPGIYISTSSRTPNPNKSEEFDEPTEITLPDFVGWEIFACNISRYTLSMCLILKK